MEARLNPAVSDLVIKFKTPQFYTRFAEFRDIMNSNSTPGIYI